MPAVIIATFLGIFLTAPVAAESLTPARAASSSQSTAGYIYVNRLTAPADPLAAAPYTGHQQTQPH